MINEHNKENLYDSLIEALNGDVRGVETRLNVDLLASFLDTIEKNELLFHPLVVKTSKFPDIFNKYVSPRINVDVNIYFENMRAFIYNDMYQLTLMNYAFSVDKKLDYSNKLEVTIASRVCNMLLTNNLQSFKDLRFFVNFIIMNRAVSFGFKPQIKFILLPSGYNKLALIRKHSFKKYTCLPVPGSFDNSIKVNVALFNIKRKTNGYEYALLYLLNTCFKNLVKAIDRNKAFSITYDDEVYRLLKEEIINKEDSYYYNNNRAYFNSNIGINQTTSNMVMEMLNNPLFDGLDISFKTSDAATSVKNSKKYQDLDLHIDELIKRKPELVKEYPMLLMEYNESGEHRMIPELIEIKNKKMAFFDRQVNNFKKSLENMYNRNIEINLERLVGGMAGVSDCHNKMIYREIRKYDLEVFKGYVVGLPLNIVIELIEVIVMVRNGYIHSLQSNRNNIFKTGTFLENDIFLTNEYALSCKYLEIVKASSKN